MYASLLRVNGIGSHKGGSMDNVVRTHIARKGLHGRKVEFIPWVRLVVKRAVRESGAFSVCGDVTWRDATDRGTSAVETSLFLSLSFDISPAYVGNFVINGGKGNNGV